MHPSTKSRKILDGWINGLNLDAVFANVSDDKTPKNKPLSKANLLNNLHDLQLKIADATPDRIVALGDTASQALSLIGQPHVRIEHPSGLNRKLNDIRVIQQIKNTLKQISLGIN